MLQDMRVSDLLEVVIFAGHPEDRHDRAARLVSELLGQLQGGDGFVDGVERSCQQPGLLPRHHSDGVGVAKGVDIGPHGVGQSPASFLFQQHVGQRLAIAVVARRAIGRRSPGLGRAKVTGVEVGHGIVVRTVLGEELGETLHIRQGNAANGGQRRGRFTHEDGMLVSGLQWGWTA